MLYEEALHPRVVQSAGANREHGRTIAKPAPGRGRCDNPGMGTELDAPWLVESARQSDSRAWSRLFKAYAASAGDDLSAEHRSRVWSWIMDPAAQTRCLLLRLAGRPEPVGLAHYRLFERPLAGSIGCYLDDLFTDEAVRGRGGARALLDHLAGLAAANGWTTVRWTTGETNPAQRLYDSLATRSPVITYNMAPR